MGTTNLVLAVQAVLSELAALGATAIESPLRDLLERAHRGEDVNLQLLELLEEPYPRVWQKIQEELEKSNEQWHIENKGTGYSPLPGSQPTVTDIDKYICSNPQCNYTWRRIKGHDIPLCEKCGSLLKRAGK